MKRLLISACLLGSFCKYSGGTNRLRDEQLEALRKKYSLVPVCPETAGGLPVPRDPSERAGERVISRSGADVTEQYRLGAETALALAERFGCRIALMKEKSPSCGFGMIYDGSFSHTLISGNGVAADMLSNEGVRIFGESDIDALLTEK